MNYEPTKAYAAHCDATDALASWRDEFHHPTGDGLIYLCGNSLGLQPRRTRQIVQEELDDWATYGVEGHFHARRPWMPYHEVLTEGLAHLVGGKSHEVVAMNSLTVNLHLMMVSFYRPTPERFKIIIEGDAFPSDRYAAASQARFHGYDPAEAVISLQPRQGEVCLRTEDILDVINKQGDEVALVLLGGVNYYTGQRYEWEKITPAAQSMGCLVGLDLAHAVGNVPLHLHDDGVDFAVWCSYKYLNGGPGAIAGAFVHERHAEDPDMPRFEGWWGHNKETRFYMRDDYQPIYGAEAWQLSNPPILSLAGVKASVDLFHEVGMQALREKSLRLTGYMRYLLDEMDNSAINVLTPADNNQHGCQLSIQVRGGDRLMHEQLTRQGVISDWREPDVIRVAPVPFYNTFDDVYQFVERIKNILVS